MNLRKLFGVKAVTAPIVIGAASAAESSAVMMGIPDSAGAIHACFNKTSGAVRLVAAEDKGTADEQAVSWDHTGVDTAPHISIVLGSNGNVLNGTVLTETRIGVL